MEVTRPCHDRAARDSDHGQSRQDSSQAVSALCLVKQLHKRPSSKHCLLFSSASCLASCLQSEESYSIREAALICRPFLCSCCTWPQAFCVASLECCWSVTGRREVSRGLASPIPHLSFTHQPNLGVFLRFPEAPLFHLPPSLPFSLLHSF